MAGLRRNSYGLQPVWLGEKRNCAQSMTAAFMGPSPHGPNCWAVATELMIRSRLKQQIALIFTGNSILALIRNFLFGLENGTIVHPSRLFATL